MKYLWPFLTLILALPGWAAQFNVYPNTKTLASNTMFIVEGNTPGTTRNIQAGDMFPAIGAVSSGSNITAYSQWNDDGEYVQYFNMRWRRPPRGFSSWWGFNCMDEAVWTNITYPTIESLITNVFLGWKHQGVDRYGYNLFDISDGSWATNRDANGNLRWHPTKFPNGLQWMSDLVHTNGWKLGLYLNMTQQGCGTPVTDEAHAWIDASNMLRYRADYIYMDAAFGSPLNEPRFRYFIRQLNSIWKSNRTNDYPFVVCSFEVGDRLEPWALAACPGAVVLPGATDWTHNWQGTLDWLDSYLPLTFYTRPGGPYLIWPAVNLVVGDTPEIFVMHQFGMAGLLNAIIETDNIYDRAWFTNRALCKMMDDPLVAPLTNLGITNQVQMLWKQQVDGWVLGLFNRNGTTSDPPAVISVNQINLPITPPQTVFDIFYQTNCDTWTNNALFSVSPQELRLLKFSEPPKTRPLSWDITPRTGAPGALELGPSASTLWLSNGTDIWMTWTDATGKFATNRVIAP